MDEIVLHEGVANPISKFGATRNGHGVLTNKRFIYSKHSLAKILVIGVLVNLTSGQYEYEIAATDIESAMVEKYLLGHALIITKKDGTTYKYGIMGPDVWRAALKKLMELERTSVPPVQGKRNFCPNCGQRLDPNANFCSGCGAKIAP